MKIDIDMATITLDEISSLMIMLNDLRNRKEVERRKFERNDREFRESLLKDNWRRQYMKPPPPTQFDPIIEESWTPEEVSSEVERLREERLAQQSRERRERRKQERKRTNPCECEICSNFDRNLGIKKSDVKLLTESGPDDDRIVEDFMDSDGEEKKE